MDNGHIRDQIFSANIAKEVVHTEDSKLKQQIGGTRKETSLMNKQCAVIRQERERYTKVSRLLKDQYSLHVQIAQYKLVIANLKASLESASDKLPIVHNKTTVHNSSQINNTACA